MDQLREFFMEDFLEKNRFSARFNMGESGGRALQVAELFGMLKKKPSEMAEVFLNISLRDSPNFGRTDLREAVARLHPGATAENVLITTGTSEALLLLFWQLRPKKVALALPGFQLLYEIPLKLGAEILSLPVRWNKNGEPYVDEDEWIGNITSQKPDVVIINHPHNPSGLVLSAQFLQRIIDACSSIHAVIIGDEHYRFLSHPAQFLGETLYRPSPTHFVTGSFTKCIGTPGLRIGWCVGDPNTLAAMQNEKNYTTHTVNPFSEWIATEVLQEGEHTVFPYLREEWMKNKSILRNFLKNSKKFLGAVPQGGLVTSIAFREASDDTTFQHRLNVLTQKGLFLLPLESMEFSTYTSARLDTDSLELARGHGMRLGLGISSDYLQLALKILEDDF